MDPNRTRSGEATFRSALNMTAEESGNQLRPDSHVKYNVVAQVLAAAQRNGMGQLGFVNTTDFME